MAKTFGFLGFRFKPDCLPLIGKRLRCRQKPPLPAMVYAAVFIAAILFLPEDGNNRRGVIAADATHPLVVAEDELAGYLEAAEDRIKEGKHDQAIDILQTLVDQPDSGFVASKDKRHYTAIWQHASRLIGDMPPEGLKLYRRLYEPKARVLFNRAVENRDVTLLRSIACRYRHTSFGPKALEELGRIFFDTGKFTQAARCWREALRLLGDETREVSDERRAVFLARIAISCHLDGDKSSASKAFAELNKSYGNVYATMSGRKRNLAAFVKQVISKGQYNSDLTEALKIWPGLGGIPDGIGVMADSKVILKPHWSIGVGAGSGEEIIPSQLLALKSTFAGMQRLYHPNFGHISSIHTHRQNGFELRLNGGNVVFKISQNGKVMSMPIPAVVEPVVVGNLLIVRREETVTAYNLQTGELVWEITAPSLPAMGSASGVAGNYIMLTSMPSFSNTYSLTAGGGKIYAVGGDLSAGEAGRHPAMIGGWLGPRPMVARPVAPAQHNRSNTSVLTAVWADSGKRCWATGYIGAGRPTGGNEVVRNGMFLCPPTYCEGRLYTVSMYMQTYYLLCLDADNGSLIWKAAISQTPAISSSYMRYMGDAIYNCSNPAVSDGRVYVLTNVGVVAAFRAANGRALWAYQYPGRFDSVSSRGISTANLKNYKAVNPILVTRGRVICLPCDADELICLKADNGKPAWRKKREEQTYLAAIDSRRIMIAGKGIFVRSVADGKVIHKDNSIDEVIGRPAVTTKSVLAGGWGGIYRMNLKDCATTYSPLVGATGFLGNLVSMGDVLIAANAAGISAYRRYSVVRHNMEADIAVASPSQRGEKKFEMAHMAFKAGRLSDAIVDLQQCRDVADKHSLFGLKAIIRPWFYRTYVAMANSCDDKERMLGYFDKAAQYAATDQEKGHIAIRRAKCLRSMGRYAEAMSAIRRLLEEYHNQDFADLPIGPQADNSVFIGEDAEMHNGAQLAKRFIRDLIDKHGREFYEVFEKQARQAYERVIESGEAEKIELVADVWPGSAWADNALYNAAGIYYQHAAEADEDEDRAGELYKKAIHCLTRITDGNDLSDSDIKSSALAARGLVWLKRGAQPLAAIDCRQLVKEEVPVGTTISFGSFEGTVGDVINRCGGSEGLALKSRHEIAEPPYEKAFSFKGMDTWILRDHKSLPVRLGDDIFVMHDWRLVRVKPDAEDADSAVKWRTEPFTDITRDSYYHGRLTRRRLIGCASGDGKIVMIAGTHAAAGIETKTGNIAWHKTYEEMGMEDMHVMAAGSDSLVLCDRKGKRSWINCIDIKNGHLRWRVNSPEFNYLPDNSLMLAEGVVTFRYSDSKRQFFFRLSDGRVIAQLPTDDYLQTRILPNRLVVGLNAKSMAVCKLDVNLPAIWETGSPGEKPILLSAAEDGVIVVEHERGRSPRLFTLTGGGWARRSLSAELVIPRLACMSGGEVYLAGPLRGEDDFLRNHLGSKLCRKGRGLGVEKIDAHGKSVWSLSLSENDDGNFWVYMPSAAGEYVLIAARRHVKSNYEFRVYVIDGRVGSIAWKSVMAAKNGEKGKRLIGLAPPVAASQRLCVEDADGVSVYKGKENKKRNDN